MAPIDKTAIPKLLMCDFGSVFQYPVTCACNLQIDTNKVVTYIYEVKKLKVTRT